MEIAGVQAVVMTPYAVNKALWHQDRLADLREGRHPYPTHLHLVLADLCNLDCGYCAFRAGGSISTELFAVRDGEGAVIQHNPNRFLDAEVARRTLGDCASMGIRAVEFTGGGEPTVHPHAASLITTRMIWDWRRPW